MPGNEARSDKQDKEYITRAIPDHITPQVAE